MKDSFRSELYCLFEKYKVSISGNLIYYKGDDGPVKVINLLKDGIFSQFT